MSVWAKKWAYEQRVGNSGAKAVLVALAEFAGEDGFCFPSQPTLARMTEIAERTVRAHLALLERKGFIRREARRGAHGRWTSDGHTLLAPPEALRPPTPSYDGRPNPPAAKSAARKTTEKGGGNASTPAANTAGGQYCRRPNSPAAKVAAKPSMETDEPSVSNTLPSASPQGETPAAAPAASPSSKSPASHAAKRAEMSLAKLEGTEREVLEAWRELVRAYPPEPAWETILLRLAEGFDRARFKRCGGAYLAYYGRGQRHVGGICDWYEENLTKPRGGGGGEHGCQRDGRAGHKQQPDEFAPIGQGQDSGAYQQRAVKNRI